MTDQPDAEHTDASQPESPESFQPTQPTLPPELLPPDPAYAATQDGPVVPEPAPNDDDTESIVIPPAPPDSTQRHHAVTPPSSSAVKPQTPIYARPYTKPVPPPYAGPTQPVQVPPPYYGVQPPPGQTAPSQPPIYPPRQNLAAQPNYGPPQPYPVYGPPRAQPKRRRRGCLSSGCLLTFGAAVIVFVGLTLIVGLVVVSALSARLEESLARLENIDERQVFQTTTIYDRNGSELYQIFEEGRRTTVHLADLPPYVAQATVAIEDDSFYENPGVDLPSVFRAALQNILNTGDAFTGPGASTITQQLVRNIAFDYEYRTTPSLQRKIEEVLLAMILTTRMSKDDILELYLNEIYYGNLAYGIEAASQTIFGKPAAELTLGEAALLAGLPQAPADLDPLDPDPAVQEAVLARRRLVIDLMLEEGYITPEQARAAYGEPLSYANPDVPLVAPHFTVFARGELEALMAALGYPPETITTGGLQVYTTIDLRYQDLAEEIARQQVAALRDAHHLTNAAVVVTRPLTGEILAMVGSVDYWDDSIDGRVNVVTAPRQPGSTMKPFTYSAAMEQGWTAANIIWDTETHIGIPGQEMYIPVNYDDTYHGPVRVRDALANSYNVPAVQTLRQVGVDYLLNLMQRFGVESLGTDAERYGLSLTLGGGEVTLLELTRAYSVFANNGALVPTTAILCVLDADDNIIYQYENACPRGQGTQRTVNALAYGTQVLDPRIAFTISDILADNAARTPAMGANSPLNTGDIVSSVKTGTTNNTRDNWTVGFTHNVAIGVWAGNSDNSAMVNTSGLTGAAPIWHDLLLAIYHDPDLLAVLAQDGVLASDALTPPPGMSRQEICQISSLQDPAAACTSTRQEWVFDGPPLVPDGAGNLVPSQTPLAPPLLTVDPAANGPQYTEIERGIIQTLVMPLPEPVAQAVAQTIPVEAGAPTPPIPRYCLIPQEVASQIPGAQALLFLAPPPVAEDAVYAAQYARARNIPFLPNIACTGEMLTGATQSQGGSGLAVITAFISSPAPGQEVRDNIPIMGTAAILPDQGQVYKFEIRGPQFPDWVTLGLVQNQPVINGQLETLYAAGLQPGQYFLRLIIVGPDGNYVQPPYEVSFIVPG